MSREVSSVRLDPDVNRARKKADESFSNNINRWAHRYYINGMEPLAADALDALIEEHQQDIKQLKELIDRAETRIERLEELKTPKPAAVDAEPAWTREDALDACKTIPAIQRSVDNPAIELWARRLNMTAEEFLEDVPAASQYQNTSARSTAADD